MIGKRSLQRYVGWIFNHKLYCLPILQRVPNGLMEVAVTELTVVDKNSPYYEGYQPANGGTSAGHTEAEQKELPPLQPLG